MELDTLLSGLESKDHAALETTDPRLAEIANLAQEREFAEAATQISNLLDEGVFDLRLIPYFLFSHFQKYGLEGLAKVFDALSAILTKNLQSFGPEKNKVHHADTAMSWFVKNLNKEIKHHEKFNDRTYKSWLLSAQESKLDSVIEAGRSLRATAAEVLNKPTSLEFLDRSLRWIADLAIFSREGSDEEGEQAKSEMESEIQKQNNPGPTEPAKSVSSKAEGMPMVEGSIHMKELMRRLQVFAMLVEKEEHFKASLVAMDIEKRLENFEPMAYFPKVFSTYTRLMSQNIGLVSSFWQSQESLAWQATKKFYEVDLEAFIDSDVVPPSPGG
jgi:hypothetical protein